MNPGETVELLSLRNSLLNHQTLRPRFQLLKQKEVALKAPPGSNRTTCCHDACGGDGQHCDVLGAVRRVEVGRPPGLPASICLNSRIWDSKKSRLVV